MRTRSETSKKNEYYISKARKYELIWFCKQYKEWQKEYNEDILYLKAHDNIPVYGIRNSEWVDIVAKTAMRKKELYDKMQLVEFCCTLLGDIGKFIFMTVVDGKSYEVLKANYPDEILWSKAHYYKEYHHFFYILSQHKHSV